jgi:hypothetical protein
VVSIERAKVRSKFGGEPTRGGEIVCAARTNRQKQLYNSDRDGRIGL